MFTSLTFSLIDENKHIYAEMTLPIDGWDKVHKQHGWLFDQLSVQGYPTSCWKVGTKHYGVSWILPATEAGRLVDTFDNKKNCNVDQLKHWLKKQN